MYKKPYSSAIKKTPFKYTIAKKIAKLILDGLDRNEVFEKCYIDNYIEIDSVQRRKEITNVIYERLIQLDNYLLNQFYDGDVITSKFILAYAIAKSDSLFFEFLFEVYRDALLSDKKYISIDDFEAFFESKKESDVIVSEWGHFTIDQLSKGYRNILVESGLGYRVKRNIVVEKVMIHPEVQEHIRLINDKEYLQALLGED
ncbi:MAG: DUF1819 family protein [Coprobacillus sp.]|nr:DUF1819 family protein [Coprobacillus sp.]MCI6329731.1 DUF1819 family protein [Erysipelotrichaceae bacterium]